MLKELPENVTWPLISMHVRGYKGGGGAAAIGDMTVRRGLYLPGSLFAPLGLSSNQSMRTSCETVAKVVFDMRSHTRMVIKSRRYAITFISPRMNHFGSDGMNACTCMASAKLGRL